MSALDLDAADLMILSAGITTVPFKPKVRVGKYVDMTTGEILTRAEAIARHRLVELMPDGRVSREALLAALRPEPRALANFLLQFRNRRGSFTPQMDTLVFWYAALHDKRPDHVRRLVFTLARRGVLETLPHGEVVPASLFSIRADPSLAEIRGEYARALNVFEAMALPTGRMPEIAEQLRRRLGKPVQGGSG